MRKRKKNIEFLKNKKRAVRGSRRIKRQILGSKRKSKIKRLAKSNKPTYSYKFIKGGNEVKGTGIVFPIIRRRDDGHFEFLATGFFINSWGGFATAKHVFFEKDEEKKEDKEIDLSILYVVHIHSNNSYSLRKIESKNLSPKGDSAIGMLESLYDSKGNLVQNDVLPMSKSKPKIGDTIKTFAYPKSKMFPENGNVDIGEFSADWFRGKVVEHFPDGRDSTFLPNECYQTSVNIYGGASGGPMINNRGIVIGINSTGYEQDENSKEEPISFITPIQEAFNIKVQIGKNKFATIEEISKIDSVKIE